MLKFNLMKQLFFLFLICAASFIGCGGKESSNTPEPQPVDADVSVNTGIRKREMDPGFFGVCLVYFKQTDKEMEAYPIEQYLKDMKCGVLRYPGGTVADNFDWRKSASLDIKRGPKVVDPSSMTTDGFISLCRRIGAEPLICVNSEVGFFADVDSAANMAANWVKYCNIEKGYNIKYWEIGNEPYYEFRFTPVEYGLLFKKVAKAMRKVDPSIKICAVGEWNYEFSGNREMVDPSFRSMIADMQYRLETESDPGFTREQLKTMYPNNGVKNNWWQKLIDVAGEDIDVVSVHWYYNLNQLTNMESLYQSLWDRIYSMAPKGKKYEMIMTEWSLHESKNTFGMERALTVAEASCKSIGAGVTKAAYWPLHYNGMHDKKGLLKDATMLPQANYKLLKFMANNIGRYQVDIASKSATPYAFASVNDEGDIFLYLINRTNVAVTTSVNFKDCPARQVNVRTMDGSANKSGDDPEEIEIQAPYDGKSMELTIPAYSMSIVTYPGR